MKSTVTQLSLLIFLLLAGITASIASPVVLGYGAAVSALPPAQAAAYFDTVKASGIQRVRIQALWPRIQPTAKKWEFTWLDNLVTQADQRGLEVVLVLGGAPKWAVSYLKNPTPAELGRARPDRLAYSNYVRTVARRYQDRVQYYQAWERPSATTLLATLSDIADLYSVAARAVHSVSPTLRLVVTEPGDVDICWISRLLSVAKGASRPDVVQLAPQTFTLRPETLWQRVAALRASVDVSKLWIEMPFASGDPMTGFRGLSAALLSGICDVWAVPADNTPGFPAGAQAIAGLRTLAALQDATLRGYAQLDNATTAGIFLENEQWRVLLLPNAAGRILVLPASQSLPGTISAMTGVLAVTPLGDVAHSVAVVDKTTLAYPPQPMLVVGLRLPAVPGTPHVDIPAVSGNSVSLDIDGTDLRAIHALPDFPSGRFSINTLDSGERALVADPQREPWIYLDVPDGFLFFNACNAPVEVTIKVRGSTAPQRDGFNLYYDSNDGMRYSRWQWIDVGPSKTYSYTMRLNDASFADRNGYDFRINAGGSKSRVQVVDVIVRKL